MKSIEQTVTFDAAPHDIFEALMDQEKHSAFTGEPATIDRRVGGAVSCFGGKIAAINLEVVPDARIVQAWRPANFPEGVFTIVTYGIEPDGGGTRLSFTQHAVPDSAYDHLSGGWHERYWKPLRTFVSRGR